MRRRPSGIVVFVGDRPGGAKAAAAVAMIHATVRVYDNRRIAFAFIVHPVRAERNTFATLNTSVFVYDRIPIFTHLQ